MLTVLLHACCVRYHALVPPCPNPICFPCWSRLPADLHAAAPPPLSNACAHGHSTQQPPTLPFGCGTVRRPVFPFEASSAPAGIARFVHVPAALALGPPLEARDGFSLRPRGSGTSRCVDISPERWLQLVYAVHSKSAMTYCCHWHPLCVISQQGTIVATGIRCVLLVSKDQLLQLTSAACYNSARNNCCN